ncbi:MAG: conjugal transfer protein TraF [bacterium]
MRALRHSVRLSLTALLISASIQGARAQLPNANPAATGLSGAYTARARGYDAVAWNPANLGMPGNPGFSISLLAVGGSSGLDPISLSDFAPYSGKTLPAAQREQWLQTVTTKGGEHGRVDGGVTFLGLSAGPVALQVATSVAGSSTINPDAFEALMFGNAGRTGVPKNLNLAGSTLRVGAFTTAGASFGFSVGNAKAGSHLALGVTGKYVLGNALVMAQDQGSATSSNAVSVNFPMVFSQPDSDQVIGSGVGADVGLAWSRGKLSFGTTVQNVFNTFAWDETKLRSKAGSALFSVDSTVKDFDNKPYASAPTALRARVTDDKFKPIVSAGFAYEASSLLILSADGRQQVGDGIAIGPKTQVGGGVEFRGIPALRLRGGASYITDGWGVSGGVGLALGKYELGVGAALRQVNGGKEPAVTINVFSIR